jgi:hypothetical protein
MIETKRWVAALASNSAKPLDVWSPFGMEYGLGEWMGL